MACATPRGSVAGRAERAEHGVEVREVHGPAAVAVARDAQAGLPERAEHGVEVREVDLRVAVDVAGAGNARVDVRGDGLREGLVIELAPGSGEHDVERAVVVDVADVDAGSEADHALVAVRIEVHGAAPAGEDVPARGGEIEELLGVGRHAAHGDDEVVHTVAVDVVERARGARRAGAVELDLGHDDVAVRAGEDEVRAVADDGEVVDAVVVDVADGGGGQLTAAELIDDADPEAVREVA